MQAYREHRTWHAAVGGEAFEPAAGLDLTGLRVARGHEALPVCSLEAWPRGGEEHECSESREQGIRHEHPRLRGLPQRTGDEGVRQHRGNLALPRSGSTGSAVYGGPDDVGSHEAATKAFGHDEALPEIFGRETMLRIEI